MLSDAPLAAIKRERMMVHALHDGDAHVVKVALRDLVSHRSTSSLAALTAFLSRTDPGGLDGLQQYALHLLRQAWTPEVGAAVATALLRRRRAMEAGARRVSRAMAGLLETSAEVEACAAARAWRRSPPGLWSACVGDRAEVGS
jgi:hypothetical protein